MTRTHPRAKRVSYRAVSGYPRSTARQGTKGRGQTPTVMSDSADFPRRQLALYYFAGCPYCARVRRSAARLGFDVELRDIHREPNFLAELVAARGSRTVPVLRIEPTPDDVRWLPESADIVSWLHAAAGAAPPARGTGASAVLKLRPWLLIGAGSLAGSPVDPWLLAAGAVGLVLGLLRR